MLTIARLTLKEIVRRRILLVTAVLAAVFLLLYGAGVHYLFKINGYNDPIKAMLPAQFLFLGLFFGCFITSFLAVMASVGAISAEVESGVIHAMLPRPIRRSEIILGKFFGYALMLSLFSAVLFFCILFTVRYSTGLPVALRPEALVLYMLEPWILLAVSIFGTTFLPTLANGVVGFMLYAIAVMGGMMEQIGYLTGNQDVVNMGIIASLIMPADAVYRKIVGIMSGGVNVSPLVLGAFGTVSQPSVWMLVYTLCYVMFFLFMAVRVFSRRDI